MANIMEILGRIKTAIYGRDVRQSIYDAILQCYNDATGNPESIAAHTGDTNNPHNVTADQVGLAPVDGVTLSILDGYIKSIVTASGLKTKDTNGLLGEANAEVMLQALIDDITNRVVNQILTKSMLINNGLTTESGKYPLDAAFGKTLADKDTELASSIAQLNSDKQDKIKYSDECRVISVSTATETGIRIKHPSDVSLSLLIITSGGVVASVNKGNGHGSNVNEIIGNFISYSAELTNTYLKTGNYIRSLILFTSSNPTSITIDAYTSP